MKNRMTEKEINRWLLASRINKAVKEAQARGEGFPPETFAHRMHINKLPFGLGELIKSKDKGHGLEWEE